MPQFKKVLTLTLVLSVILMQYAGAQNSFYLAADAGFSSFKEGIYSEKEFQTNFGLQFITTNNLIIEAGLGLSNDKMKYHYRQYNPNPTLGYSSSYYSPSPSAQYSKSLSPFISVGYLKSIVERIQIGGKLNGSYSMSSTEIKPTVIGYFDLQYNVVSSTGNTIDVNSRYFKSSSFNVSIAPFFRFFIWERFGADLYLGSLSFNKVLNNELNNYPDSYKKPEELKLNLSPSNWTFGLFWKINK